MSASHHCRHEAHRRSWLNERRQSELADAWYLDQCDNDWEHSYGVEIGTLDNPGWTLKINLRDTALKGRTFKKITQGEPAGNLDEWRRTGSWWVADVKDGAFEAACGPLDLPSVVSVFREWAESDPQA